MGVILGARLKWGWRWGLDELKGELMGLI